MIKSALQLAREAYEPKLPGSLKGAVKIVEGKKTESIADQADIEKLFPNTYGMPLLTFEPGEKKDFPVISVGVILS
ncbi:MAG TPA: diphosphate--fructose-6-phosphate 1-phosphotransferase, partial [Bacteroidales bacterium]|nr:diphosphate--fructose-6-phosphate 1-phosphotransferase [Bacteroidales bacterium]